MNETQRMINEAGWWKGSWQTFWQMPQGEREALAFQETGCEAAVPTWKQNSARDCVHLGCQVRRGKVSKVDACRRILQAERQRGWLQDVSDERFQQILDAMLPKVSQTGIWDPWELGWQLIVFSAIAA